MYSHWQTQHIVSVYTCCHSGGGGGGGGGGLKPVDTIAEPMEDHPAQL